MRIGILAMLAALGVQAQATWIMRTIAGGGPEGGPAAEANLNRPVGLCGAGYIVARDAHRVYRLEPDGTLAVAAGNGTPDFAGDGGAATAAALHEPLGCAVDAAGTLYIADSRNQRVRRVDAEGVITTVAVLGQPVAVAVDAAGALWVADGAAHTVVRVSGGAAMVMVGSGRAGFAGDGGPAGQAQLSSPAALAFDAQGRLLIADRGNGRVRRLEPNGLLQTVPGLANLDGPRSLAVDARGALYVAEARRVRRLAPDGTLATVVENEAVAAVAWDGAGLRTADEAGHRVRRWQDGRATVLAGNGTPGFSGDGGPALRASLANPRGVWASETELLIGDTDNNRVRRVDLATGVISTVAALEQPWGVTRDARGGLVAAEARSGRVRRIGADGTATTVAGGGTLAADVAPATQARLLEPVGVAADDDGQLFLAERGNSKLRRVTPDGGLSTLAGNGQNRVIEAMAGSALALPVAAPHAVAFDGTAVFYTDDSAHIAGRVQGGRLEVAAGTRAAAPAAVPEAGPAIRVPLARPRGIAPDYSGGFFLSEEGGHRIRYADRDGALRLIAGSLVSKAGFTGDDPAKGGLLRAPGHLAFVPPCTLYAADTGNQRIRRLRPEIRYTVRPEPEFLELAVDDEIAPGPRTFSWEALTQHVVLAPSPQPGETEGTRWVAPPGQMIDLACIPAEASLTVPFTAQHLLSVTAGEGGTVSPETGWHDAGSEVTLTAQPAEGFVFAGWEGDCAGSGACVLKLEAPRRVKAIFEAR